MTDGDTVLFGAVGAVAAMLAVLVPVIRGQAVALRREIEGQGTSLRRAIQEQGTSLRRAIKGQGNSLHRAIEGRGESLSREIDTLRGDVAEVRRDLHVLSDRVARIEGALTGPWRPPTNGGTSNPVEPPAAASEVP